MAAQYDMLSGVEVERYVCGLADYFTARLAQTPWLRLAYDFPAENRCQIVYIKVAAGCPVTDEMLQACSPTSSPPTRTGSGACV